jgi:hypothetical protein
MHKAHSIGFCSYSAVTTHEKKQERHPGGLACKSCKRKMREREKKIQEHAALQTSAPALGQQMGLRFLKKCTNGPYGRWNFGVLESAFSARHTPSIPVKGVTISGLKTKDQRTYLILSINTSITASMYVYMERTRLILWTSSKKWLRLI